MFPGVGHGVLGSNTRAERIVDRFLDDPDVAVDGSCAADPGWPTFR